MEGNKRNGFDVMWIIVGVREAENSRNSKFPGKI